MARRIELQQATAEHYDFALQLYLRTLGPYLGSLLATWRTTEKKIVLRVLKNNPARQFYERLGFSVIAEAGVVYRMRA
ncbi:MAG: hypothetical protein K2X57_20575 [Xanthobacteraceae bacterium]|nr:hypothetical protein [Xanthobacteraceae bacterium]